MKKIRQKKQNQNTRRQIGLLVLVLSLSLLFCACGGNKTDEKAQDSKPTETAITASESAITTEAGIEGGQPEKSSEGTTAAAVEKKSTAPSKNDPAKAKNTKAKETPVCTFSIDCLTILDNMDKLDSSKVSIVPEDGMIYGPKEIKIEKGESVFDLLLRITKDNKIHMEFTKTPALNTNYVEGIANLYEFDCGELSGWTYKVNGEVLGTGSSNTIIKNGDVVEWKYTCDQGKDVE